MGTGSWQGGVSDGTTLWFVNNSSDNAVAYVAATRARDSDKDISHTDLSGFLFGGVYANNTIWFVEPEADTAIAFRFIPPAEAPTVTIAAQADIDEDETASLSASISGGTYDGTPSYAWAILTGGGSISGSGSSVTYTPSDVASNQLIQVRCTVTVTGTGTNAEDGTSDTASDTETFTVRALIAPSFTDSTGDAQTWTQGETITSITVPSASGYPTPTYAVEGSLPAGIAFNTSTRVLSGTPTATGSGTITIRATNSEDTADWTVAYTTNAPLSAPSFTDNTGDAQTWTQNQAITDITVPAASGNPTPTYAVEGALPDGIAFSTSTRVLSGSPTAVGTGTITIRATNSEGMADWTVTYTTRAPVEIDSLPAQTGERVRMLITAGTFNRIYSRRGDTVGSVSSDSDLTLTDSVTVDRVQINTGSNWIRLFSADFGGNAIDLFGAGGDGENADLTLVTPYGTVALTDVDEVNAGSDWAAWHTVAADNTILSQISAGDMVLVVAFGFITTISLQGAISTGNAALAGDLSSTDQAVTELQGGISTGTAALAGNLNSTDPGVTSLEGDVSTGDAALTGDLTSTAQGVTSLAGGIATGDVALAGNVTSTDQVVASLAGGISAGGVETAGNLTSTDQGITSLAGGVSTGGVDTAGNLSAIDPGITALAGRISTGIAAPGGDLTVFDFIQFAGNLSAGEAALSGNLASTDQAVASLAGNVSTGNAALSGNFTSTDQGTTELAGGVSTGSVFATGNLLSRPFVLSLAGGISTGDVALSGDATTTAGEFTPRAVRSTGAVAQMSASGTVVELTWQVPLITGIGPITDYEISVIDENGHQGPWESTGSTETKFMVRGLAFGRRYGFRVRGVNSDGSGTESVVFYATPQRSPVVTLRPGQRMPLLDADRQSVIVRLNNIDCRVSAWWQPSDSSYYGSLEVPVNTNVVRSRRLAVNSGLLDRVRDVLPGNVVFRALEDGTPEAKRGAFAAPTHGLFWMPD